MSRHPGLATSATPARSPIAIRYRADARPTSATVTIREHRLGTSGAGPALGAFLTTLDLTADKFNDTIEGNDIVLVDFWASWCGPCRQFGPTFQASAEKHPDIVHAKVDTEAEQELAAAAQIRSIPTLMAFKRGKLLFNQAGALPPAALEDLVQQIRAFDIDAAGDAADDAGPVEQV